MSTSALERKIFRLQDRLVELRRVKMDGTSAWFEVLRELIRCQRIYVA